MNCFNHPELVSVGVCQDCQKGLCVECASKYSFPICSQCNGKRKNNEKIEIYKELVLTFGLGILCAYLWLNFKEINLNKSNIEKIPICISAVYVGAAIFAGWKTLSSFTSNYFLFLPIIGWLIYFIVKLWISVIVGMVMLPVRTFKNFRRLIQLKNIPK